MLPVLINEVSVGSVNVMVRLLFYHIRRYTSTSDNIQGYMTDEQCVYLIEVKTNHYNYICEIYF